MESLLELFGSNEIGGITVYKLALIIGAIAFVIRKLVVVTKMITDIYKAYQDREEELAENAKICRNMQKEVKRLSEVQKKNTEKLIKFEEEIKRRDKNKIKTDLLGWFHFYTNKAKNPQLAWTEMESDVFWSNFAEYEDLGGNGFMHNDVRPAMNALEIVSMDDHERLTSLYASRDK